MRRKIATISICKEKSNSTSVIKFLKSSFQNFLNFLSLFTSEAQNEGTTFLTVLNIARRVFSIRKIELSSIIRRAVSMLFPCLKKNLHELIGVRF